MYASSPLVSFLLVGACGSEPEAPPSPPPEDTAASDTDAADTSADTADASGDTSADTSADTADTSSETSADTADTAEASGPYTGTHRLTNALATYDGHTEDDSFGNGVAYVGDVNGDGCAGILVGAFNWETNGGAFLVCTPTAGRYDIAAAATGVVAASSDPDTVGAALAGGADFNGDGLPDVVVGSWGTDEDRLGQVKLLSGPFSGTVPVDDAWLTITGTEVREYLGHTLSVAGDVTGDGVPDLAIGSNRSYEGDTTVGGAYILSGASTPSGNINATDVDIRLDGVDYATWAGSALHGAGDVDGDGVDDLVVTGAAIGGSAYEGGIAWIVLGPIAGTTTLPDVGIPLEGTGYGGGISLEAAGVGDLDGDGYRDVGLGLTFAEAYAGAVWVFPGPPGALHSVDDAPTFLYGSWDDRIGYAAYPIEAGDMNNDGVSDLAIGAPTSTGDSYDKKDTWTGDVEAAGAVVVMYGPLPRGTYNLGEADVIWRGEQEWGLAGAPLAAPGDLDGDGCDDLIVGSTAYGDDHRGHSWLVGGCAP